jgi:hypothetical protein
MVGMKTCIQHASERESEAGGMAHVVENLLSRSEALSSKDASPQKQMKQSVVVQAEAEGSQVSSRPAWATQ